MPKSSKLAQKQLRHKYSLERKRIAQQVKRLSARGFVFEETIIPPKISELKTKKLTQKDIRQLEKLTSEKIYKKASFYQTAEGKISPQKGIEIEREKRKILAIKNLRKGKSFSDITEDNSIKGQRLLEEYEQAKLEGTEEDFFKSHSAKDIIALMDARDKKYADFKRRYLDERREDDLDRQAREDILPDEESQYWQDEEDEIADSIKQKRAVDDEIRRGKEEEVDEKVKKWKQEWERQKYKKKSEKEYVYDGDSIYFGIINRIEQFESDFMDKKFADSHWANNKAKVSFKKMLENEIKTEGLNTVLRRLDNHGMEIDTALEEMLYRASKQEDVNMALNRLAEIIKGRSLDQQESAEIDAYSEFMSSEDEDSLRDYYVDYQS